MHDYLQGLRPELREGLYLTAVPFQFDYDFFIWLWGRAQAQKGTRLWPWQETDSSVIESGEEREDAPLPPTLYLDLRQSELIEATSSGTYRLKPAVRQLLLRHVWGEDLVRFQWFNRQCYRYVQGQDPEQGRWHTAVLYHRLLADPDREVDNFKVELLNSFQFQHEEREWITRLLPFLYTAVEANCLHGRAAAWVHCGQAWLLAEQHQLEPARTAYRQAINAPAADLLLRAGCTLALAELYLPPYDGQIEIAAQLVQAAQKLYQQMGNWQGYANCHHIMADIARLRGEPNAAQTAYHRAYRIYQRLGERTQAAHCLHDAAQLHVDLAQIEAARQKFRTARHAYYKTGRLTPWLGSSFVRANFLKDEAIAAFHLGDYDESQEKIFAALALYDLQTSEAEQEQPFWSKGRAFELLGQIEQKRTEWREAARWYREASAQYRLGEFTSDLARLLSRQAEISRAEENSTRAIAQLEQAAKLQRQLGHTDEEARFYLQAAATAESNYDDERALNYLTEARSRYVASGNRLQLIECDWLLGQFYERTDALHTAEQWYEQALAEAEAIYDRLGQGHAQRKLAWLALQQGDLPTARQHYAQAAHCYQHLPDWPGLGYVFLGQGWLAWYDNDPTTAVVWWQEAYTLAQQHEALRLQVRVLLAQAEAGLGQGNDTAVHLILREAETIAQGEHDQWQLSFVYLLWARLSRQSEEFDQAQTHLHWAWEAAEMAHAPLAQAEILLEQVRLAQVQGDMDTAVQWLARAHAQFDQLELDHGAMACRVLGAELAWQRGETHTAVVQIQQALAYYEEIGHHSTAHQLHHWLDAHPICHAISLPVGQSVN